MLQDALAARTPTSVIPSQHDGAGLYQHSELKFEPDTPVHDQWGVMSAADVGASVPARAKCHLNAAVDLASDGGERLQRQGVL